VALLLATAAFGLLAFSSTLDPVDALLGRGRIVAVPDVVGETRPRALADLEEVGLSARITSAYSLSVPRGSVVAQTPPPGERLREGSVVEVVVSEGVRRVEMPDAVGRQLREVEPELLEAGIPVTVERVVSEQVPAGQVIAQDPRPGVVITAQDEVVLEVSEGPADRPVPEVLGLSVDAAAFELGAAGLVPGAIELVDDPTVPQGAVLAAEPAPGDVVPIDTEVSLRVSAGPTPVPVPDVRNRSASAARDALEALGFPVVVAGRLVAGPDAGVGSVFGQYPEPGVPLRPGEPVTIVVGREAPAPPPRAPAATTTTEAATTTTTPGGGGG
jgi:serine/threonine-protein kinase